MSHNKPETLAQDPAALAAGLPAKYAAARKAADDLAQAGRLIHQNGIYYAVTKPEIVTGSGEALSITADHWHFIRGTENEA